MGRIHLGSILGTTITLDFSFLFVIVLWILSYIQTAGVRYALLWAPVLLISILVHELAHAATIGIFGYGPSQIFLQGIGGVTINERRARPWQDLLISAAGPAASFLLAWSVSMIVVSVPYARHDPFLVALLPLLAQANLLWAFFNLLPVAPLDGYGILRNFLRMFLNERTSFVIAIWISMVVGGILVVISVFLRQPFVALLLLWFIRSSYMQWQFFRSYNRTDD